MDRFRIGILGADTPQGQQLMRLLLGHPIATLVAVSSRTGAASLVGTSVSDMFPALRDLCALPFTDEAQVLTDADVVFCADAEADNEELIAACIKNKCVALDLGTSFRLVDEEEHRLCFGTGFAYPGLHDAAVYGLPELLREHMSGRVLAGIPGAAATAALLALVPLVSEGLIETEGIVIDAKLPAPEASACGLYCADGTPASCSDAAAEIEQLLSEAAGRKVAVTVTSCRTPSRRGLLVTCSAKGTLSANSRTLRSALNSYYADERFVRVLPPSGHADASAVEGSNMCDISARFDERTGRVILCAALDSLMKGSAGQAVQCMNRLLSMPEEIGLEAAPMV